MTWTSTDPFPHLIRDDAIYPEMLDAVLEEWPGPDAGWQAFDNPLERKRALNRLDALGPATRDLLAWFNSADTVAWLGAETHIDGLVADPSYVGGGLHEIAPGGYLEVHADFNVHPATGLDRRLNALLYLNRDWRDEWGGHLELCGPDAHCVVRLAPVFNRLVVFATTDTSFHGHPEPLACPLDRCRRSLAFYYYSAGRPESERSPSHSTLFPRA